MSMTAVLPSATSTIAGEDLRIARRHQAMKDAAIIRNLDPTADDGQRERDRAEIRRVLAEMDSRDERLAIFRKEATSINREAAQLQGPIEKLETEILDAMVSSGPVEALQQQLKPLKDKFTALKERGEILERELANPALTSDSRGVLEDAISRAAPLALAEKKFAAEKGAEWANSRAEKARNTVAELVALIDKREPPRSVLNRRLANWRAELKASTDAAVQAQKLLDHVLVEIRKA